MGRNVLSFDLEHWYTATLVAESVSNPDDHICESTRLVLSLCDRHDVTATFFVVGEVAEEYPDIVAEVADAGHDIASHDTRTRRCSISPPRNAGRNCRRVQKRLRRRSESSRGDSGRPTSRSPTIPSGRSRRSKTSTTTTIRVSFRSRRRCMALTAARFARTRRAELTRSRRQTVSRLTTSARFRWPCFTRSSDSRWLAVSAPGRCRSGC